MASGTTVTATADGLFVGTINFSPHDSCYNRGGNVGCFYLNNEEVFRVTDQDTNSGTYSFSRSVKRGDVIKVTCPNNVWDWSWIGCGLIIYP